MQIHSVWTSLKFQNRNPRNADHSVEDFSPFLNGKILDQSKFKAFADDKMDVSKKLRFVWGRVENIVGNGENAGYRHFLLFPHCFQKPVFTRAEF